MSATIDTNRMEIANYLSTEFFDKYGDPRVAGLVLMRTPWPIISMCVIYLWFVKVIGPAFMQDRKPYELFGFIRVYNLIMVIWNTFGFIVACWLLNFGLDTFGCQPVDPRDRSYKTMTIITYGHLFLLSRIVEFIDTICFVLRKKQRQISGFHVFHHFSVPIAVWFFFKFAPGGNAAIFPLLNTLIHTIMYTYYFLATFESLRPYLGWKKYLTLFQIIQFIIMIVHSAQVLFLPDCEFPRIFLYINCIFSVVFIYLFTKFYIDNYGKQTVRVATTVGRRISQQVQHGVRRLSTIDQPPPTGPLVGVTPTGHADDIHAYQRQQVNGLTNRRVSQTGRRADQQVFLSRVREVGEAAPCTAKGADEA